jgi:hypothetical protein
MLPEKTSCAGFTRIRTSEPATLAARAVGSILEVCANILRRTSSVPGLSFRLFIGLKSIVGASRNDICLLNVTFAVAIFILGRPRLYSNPSVG